MTRLTLASLLAAGIFSACNVDPFPLFHNLDGGGGDAADGGGDDDTDAPVGVDSTGGGDGAPDASLFDACTPHEEQCNEVDDDCDGTPDNGFNLMGDPNNCGECGRQCNLPNMAGTCDMGQCVYTCLPCFHDLNMDTLPPIDEMSTNGCEYACCPTLDGIEACDG